MKLVEIGWNFEFWKLVETLILQAFEIYSKKNLSNQVIRFISKRTNKKEELHTKVPLFLNIWIIILISKKVEFELKYSAIYCILQKEKTLEISVFLLYWFVLKPYFTSVKITCLRNFGEYFFNWRRSGVLRLFLEVRYKRSPDSLCSSVIFTRMVSPFYYSAAAALAILRPL